MMRNTTGKLGPLALAGLAMLAACPSDDGPMGSTETETSTTTPTPTTSADTTESSGDADCGNGAIDDDEQCDGTDLGGYACADVNPAFESGTLACGSSCTFDATGCMVAPGSPLVTLNEVTSKAVLAGPYAGPNDAIELHNAGSVAADLSGWRLSDDPGFDTTKTYVFPAGTMLDPGAFLVLLSFEKETMTGVLPFKVSDSDSETLSLADGNGGIVDAVVVDGYAARVSYCRVPDATGPWYQCMQTFGAQNVVSDTVCGDDVAEGPEECDGDDLASATCERLGLGFSDGTLTCKPSCRIDSDACTTDSQIVLNELSSTTDDIEIYNGGRAAVDLSGWVLTDDDVDGSYDVNADEAELVFPAGTVLGPNEYLVVAKGLLAGQHPFGLGLMGDTITLLDPEPVTIIDRVAYDDGQAAVSYCRQPNGPGGAWMAGCTPSMGAEN